jgi:hypothetical protein
MICECGTTRVDKAKFCTECGRKFNLSDDETFKLEQHTLFKEIEKSKVILEELSLSIHSKSIEIRIEIVSQELYKKGLVDQKYERLNVDEMSFVEIVSRTSFYLKNE